jgi:hypothetical protein
MRPEVRDWAIVAVGAVFWAIEETGFRPWFKTRAEVAPSSGSPR